MSGEEIDVGLALEYIAGEFLATYQAQVEQDTSDAETNTQSERRLEEHEHETPQWTSELVAAELDPNVEARLSPDGADLPSVNVRPYAAIHQSILERDGFRCQYPG